MFVEELTGTLYTIAKDVKLQIEFNPSRVESYRLLGYENRLLAASDFNDDTKDAGEIGAGHSVTALYALVPVQAESARNVKPLKYQQRPNVVQNDNPELLTVSLHYKTPDQDRSTALEYPVLDSSGSRRELSDNLTWSAAVAAFGMILRDSRYSGQSTLELVSELALGAVGPDPSGRRREFVDLVYKAQVIQARKHGRPAPPDPRPVEQSE